MIAGSVTRIILGVAFACGSSLSVAFAAPESAANALARQEQFSKRVEQSADAIIKVMENQLNELRPRMKTELVGQDFVMLQEAPVSFADDPDHHNCGQFFAPLPPCVNCERLSDRDFDGWFDRLSGDFAKIKAYLNADEAAWGDERRKNASGLKPDDLGKPVPPAWLARENSYYQELYLAVAWMANLVYSLEAAELLGPRITRKTLGLAGQDDASGRYHRTPEEFGGMFDVMSARSVIATGPAARNVQGLECKASAALQQLQSTWTTPDEAAWHAAQNAAEEGRRTCQAAEDSQRDALIAEFRKLRDRYVSEHAAFRNALGEWRQSLIGAHLYAGEGSAAITDIYSDGHELRLDYTSTMSLFLPFSGRLRAAPQISNTTAGASVDLSAQRANIASSCYRGQENLETIKYADVEKEPFQFGMQVGVDRQLQSSVLTVRDRDKP